MRGKPSNTKMFDAKYLVFLLKSKVLDQNTRYSLEILGISKILTIVFYIYHHEIETSRNMLLTKIRLAI